MKGLGIKAAVIAASVIAVFGNCFVVFDYFDGKVAQWSRPLPSVESVVFRFFGSVILMLSPIVGVVIGLAGAYGVTRAITSVLYGVSATDPLTFILVSLLLVGVALLACYVPARIATKVKPLIALRYE